MLTHLRGPGLGDLLYEIAGWSARHAWLVLAAWVIALTGTTIGGGSLGGQYSDNLALPTSPSQAGLRLLVQDAPALVAANGQIVFQVTSGTLEGHRPALETAIRRIRKLPAVLAASDLVTAVGGRTALSTLIFDAAPGTLGPLIVREVNAALAPARAGGVRVSLGGQLGDAARPATSDVPSEVAGIAVALIVLLVGFRRVYAALLPILTAVAGVLTGLGLLRVLASEITIGTVAPTLATMIGLGVGIDYALFITARQLQSAGRSPVEAAARAVATSGRAVLVAATTVIIALLGLYASGISFVGNLGLAASVAVATSATAALTLYPALLSRTVRPRGRHARTRGGASRVGWWQTYAAAVGRHPVRYLIAAVGLLAFLAIPALSLRLGIIDDSFDPPGFTDRIAADAVARAYGPGTDAPLIVVLSIRGLGERRAAAAETAAARALRDTRGVASVSPIQASANRAIAYAEVIPRSAAASPATSRLLGVLRSGTLPRALAGTGASGSVTGVTAFQLDFQQQLSSRLGIIIGSVVAAAFILLVLTFRSPVLALKAAVLNLLSVGASYGVLVAVFQWSWGRPLLGLTRPVPIESYVPMIMFVIVFGLSMDYEVFLLSRIREHWLAHHDNQAAVAHGLAATARVITCAAVIMASVFFSFLLSENMIVRMLALGLGVSVLIDATLIRLIAVPAAMLLLDRANWWTPSLPRRQRHPVPPAPVRPRASSGSGYQ
jgi:RND superfamily putative drug exporter